MSLGLIITSPKDVAQGAQALVGLEPRFAEVLRQIDEVPLRLRPQGFASLLDIIVSQQVSVASADAIRARMKAAGLTDPAAVLSAGDEGLRAAGLSRPKVRYAQALAEADLDYLGLHDMADAEVAQTLCSIKGIGPWSAQIYLMFCMGRADAFAPGDLALQEAAKVLFELAERPSAPALEEMSLAWSPWRAVAARMLFAYYRVIKSRDGL
jgi:DNA-3-methyladenine glycosylase II